MWVWILVAIGVAMIASLVLWAIWLAHKAGDVYHQLADLGSKVGKLAEQVERLDLSPLDQPTPRAGDLPGHADVTGADVAAARRSTPQARRARPS